MTSLIIFTAKLLLAKEDHFAKSKYFSYGTPVFY